MIIIIKPFHLIREMDRVCNMYIPQLKFNIDNK